MKRNQDSQFARRIQEKYHRDTVRCHMLEQQMDEELVKAEPDFDKVDALVREIALLQGQMQEPEYMKQEHNALLPVLFRKMRFFRIEWIGMIAAAVFLGLGLSIYPTIQEGRSTLEVVEPTQFVQTAEATVSGTSEAATTVSQNPTETQTTAVTENAGETDRILTGSGDASPVETALEQPDTNTDMVTETNSAASVKQTTPVLTGNAETSAGTTMYTTHNTQTSRTTVSTAAVATTDTQDEETSIVTTEKTSALPGTTTTVIPGTTQTTTTFTTLTTTQTATLTTTQTTTFFPTLTTTQTTMLTTTQTTITIWSTEQTTMKTTDTTQTTTVFATDVTTTTQPETTTIDPQLTSYLFLHSYPDKIEYQPGEEVDFTGANISAGYCYTDEDGVERYEPEVYTQDLTSEAVSALIESGVLTVDTSQLDMNTPGTYHVILWYTYGDTASKASFPIFVNDPAESTAASETSTTVNVVTSTITSYAQKKDSFSEQEGSL